MAKRRTRRMSRVSRKLSRKNKSRKNKSKKLDLLSTTLTLPTATGSFRTARSNTDSFNSVKSNGLVSAPRAESFKKTKKTKRRKRGPSPYNKFVKEMSPKLRKANPGLKQPQIMKLIAEEWKKMPIPETD